MSSFYLAKKSQRPERATQRRCHLSYVLRDDFELAKKREGRWRSLCRETKGREAKSTMHLRNF